MVLDDLRTTLARLEMASSAPTQAYDPSGGHSNENPGGKRPPGTNTTAADWYRQRHHQLNHDQPMRVEDQHGNKTRDTYERLLGDACRELEQITGRTNQAPQATKAMDVKKIAQEDAPTVPAEKLADRLGVSVFQMTRWYVDWQLDPLTGASLTDRNAEDEMDLIARAREMARRGMTQKQIAMRLGKSQPTVSRYLRRRAA